MALKLKVDVGKMALGLKVDVGKMAEDPDPDP